MSFFDTGYLRAQQSAEKNPSVVISVFVIFFAIAIAGIVSLRLDLSFRPLFASGAEIAEPTEEFEEVFGQASGAWISAILENTGSTTPAFIRSAADLSEIAADIPRIAEVLSITTVQIPQWEHGNLSLASPIPEALLENEATEMLEQRYEALLDGTRFVNWLVSADGSKLLLAARLDLPLEDLQGRRAVVTEFESLLLAEAPADISLHFSGVSVVELAYERELLKDQLLATTITSFVLMLLLFWTFGNLKSVIICLAPVSLAIPATLGIMGWLGQPVTIINTAIPAIVLAIGVADAVHMLTAWLESRGEGNDKIAASRSMLATTGKACFFTTVTTMGGFAALMSAQLESVGSFGLSVALGILLAWLSNQIVLPWLLRRVNAGDDFPGGIVNRHADNAVKGSIHFATQRPRTVVTIGVLFCVACAFMISSITIDQRFNEELPASHSISKAQTMFEQEFGGFLGPEVSVRRHDGASMIDDNSLRRLQRYADELQNLPDTKLVWSIQDLLPQMVVSERKLALGMMRASPAISQRVNELINSNNDRLAVIIRIGDIGTQRADEYRLQVKELANVVWGDEYDVEIVGQWWLAQYGMRLLLSDMLISLITAVFIVMPLMWFALRQFRLFFAAAITNLLPLFLPLAFMAAAGITLRIGTSVVLAIALGIAVDNTLHIIIRMRAQSESNLETGEPVDLTMRGTGRAVIFTTLALVGGFLSMMSNSMLAIRDMGLVAAVTIAGAMLADILFLPALYVLLRRSD